MVESGRRCEREHTCAVWGGRRPSPSLSLTHDSHTPSHTTHLVVAHVGHGLVANCAFERVTWGACGAAPAQPRPRLHVGGEGGGSGGRHWGVCGVVSCARRGHWGPSTRANAERNSLSGSHFLRRLFLPSPFFFAPSFPLSSWPPPSTTSPPRSHPWRPRSGCRQDGGGATEGTENTRAPPLCARPAPPLPAPPRPRPRPHSIPNER